MPSTLSIDRESLNSLLSAYLPGGAVGVEDGKLIYQHQSAGLKVALSSLLAGGTLTYRKLGVVIESLELKEGKVAAKFSITGDGK